MSKLSDKQGKFVEYNARSLDLSYEEENLLLRTPFIEMSAAECETLVDSMWEYARRAPHDHETKNFIRASIHDIIMAHKEELSKIK